MSVLIRRYLWSVVLAALALSAQGQSASQDQQAQPNQPQASPSQNAPTVPPPTVTAAPPPPLQGTPAAILHTQGGVWVNGSEARDSTAIFSGDLIETKPNFSATLNLEGSEVLLAAESVVKFDADLLELDHGSVSVGTSKGLKVRANCILVVPASSEWTQYEVGDVTGTVQVAARKHDVNVEHGGGGKNSASDSTAAAALHEGEQKSFDESELCGGRKQPTTAGSSGLNTKWIAAGAAGAGLLIWLLIHNSGGQSNMSQSTP